MGQVIDFSKKHKINEMKKTVVFNTILQYYKDLNDTGIVTIPYFLRARDKYNKLIKDNKDLNFYYNKIIERYKIL